MSTGIRRCSRSPRPDLDSDGDSDGSLLQFSPPVTHVMSPAKLIARTWRGAVRAEDADAYLEYLEKTGLANYRGTPGNRGAMVLQRMLGSECEFLIVSFWESRESIKAFAGEDISVARFYPEDDRFLVNRDLAVNHYEVVWSDLAAL